MSDKTAREATRIVKGTLRNGRGYGHGLQIRDGWRAVDQQSPTFAPGGVVSLKVFNFRKGFASNSSSTHNASAGEVVIAVNERWMPERPFGDRITELDDATDAGQDLAVALTIAHLVRLEWQVRAGQVALAELNPKEIQIFNRVTKTFPVSLLGRDWIRLAA